MKINLLVPFFAPNKDIENQRRKEFREWCINIFEKKIKELYNDIEVEYLFAYTDQVDPVDENFLMKYDGPTPKGTMVRGKLISVVSKIDYAHIEDNYFILIDGSGKIVYDSVFKVIDALNKGKQIVLGCRPKDYGISDDRKLIELFENFLVEEKYKVILPDAQCGCWGIHVNALKLLPLTAKSYEIELDLISSAIEHKLPICFIPVEINISQPLITNFNFEANFIKLNFLTNKLGLDKYLIKSFYNKFKEIRKVSLPESYIDHFEKVPSSQYRNKFDCIGDCHNPCDKVYKPFKSNSS